MSALVALLGPVVSGCPSNAVWDLVKVAWTKTHQTSWEELYLEAFQQAVDEARPRLRRYSDGDEPDLDRAALSKALHQDLSAHVDTLPYSRLSSDQFATELAKAMQARDVLVIQGHNLSLDDYTQLIRNLVQHATARFRDSIL